MYKLVKNIHVHGTDIFGRPAQFHLFPNGRKGIPHWTIRENRELQTRVIKPSMLRHDKGTVRLKEGVCNFPEAENILPLAWFVAGVHIIQISSQSPRRMPGELYDPTSAHSIRSSCEKSKPRDWEPIIRGAEWESSKKRNGTYGVTRVYPLERHTLEVFVSIEYPGIGHFEKTYDIEKLTEDEVIRILSVRPLVVPKFPRIAKSLQSLFRQPFVNATSWPDVSSEEARQKMLRAWADRRFVEILGTFSTLVDGHDCPAMRIESINSDCEADIGAAQRVIIARPPTQPTRRLQ